RSCGVEFYDIDTGLCSLSLTNDLLSTISERSTKKGLSFNNFIVVEYKAKTFFIIPYASSQKNWKLKIFKFMEVVNDCLKFPLLFSLDIHNVLASLHLQETSITEFLQVLLQFDSNAYLHRYRLYTHDRKIKKAIDLVLDKSHKHHLKLSRITPDGCSDIYSTWRRTGAVYRSAESYTAIVEPAVTSTIPTQTHLKNPQHSAMEEQRLIWKTAESKLLQKFSQFYRAHRLNERTIKELRDSITDLSGGFNIIDLNTGELLFGKSLQKKYSFGYDGSRFVELIFTNELRYTISHNLKSTNEIVLVSENTGNSFPDICHRSVKQEISNTTFRDLQSDLSSGKELT
ncbi:hypothetical protein J6590_107848, partial [Homalodisca vitripennis]